MDREQGQVTVLAAVMVALTMTVVLALGRLGTVLVQQARAASAADASALAGLNGGPSAAAAVAGANDGRLLSVEVGPGWCRVTVDVGGRRASSAAALVE
ncbi:MAG: pilus assembly protein TadG-related protein [Acidimicrobiales bacterium]